MQAWSWIKLQFFTNTDKTNPWPVKRATQAQTALRASSSRIVFIVIAELSCILSPACECTPRVPRATGNASSHKVQDRSNDRLSCSVVRWMAHPASSRSNLFAEWSLNKAKTSPPSANSCPCRSCLVESRRCRRTQIVRPRWRLVARCGGTEGFQHVHSIPIHLDVQHIEGVCQKRTAHSGAAIPLRFRMNTLLSLT